MEQVKAWLLPTSWYPYTRDRGLFFLNCPSFQPFKDRLCFSGSVTPFSAEKKNVTLIHLCASLHPDGCRCTRWPRTCHILSCLQGPGRLLGDLSQEEGKASPSHTKQQVHKPARDGWTFSREALALLVLIFSAKSEGDAG